MKLSSLLFSASLPAIAVAFLAGAPALTALAFVATALVLGLAFDDYNRRPALPLRSSQRVVAKRRHARLPLAA